MNRIYIAAAVLALVVCAIMLSDSGHQSALAEGTPQATGNLKVYYDLDFGNGKGGGRSTPLECTRIGFHENYLVLRTKAGGGEVIPISQIEGFRWEQ